MKLVIPVSPVPASRPRVARSGHTYYAGPYKTFKRLAADAIEQLTLGEPFTDPITVVVRCVVQRPKTTKLPFPKPDVDNFVKAVFDALNDKAFADDWLICRMAAEKEWAPPGEPGYIEVEILEGRAPITLEADDHPKD